MHKKPGKMLEQVHTTGHLSNNMVDAVRPGLSVIYNYTEKLETELLNLRASGCRGSTLALWGTDAHTLGLINIELQPIVGHLVIGKVETGLK